MKRFAIVAFIIGFAQTILAQCPEQLSGWERVLTGSSYTWSWRLLGEPAKWGDGSTIPNSTLLSYINSALSQWQNAANSQGAVITLTYTSDYENADIVVQFLDRGPGSCGNTVITTTPKAISINSSQEAHWSYNGTGIDLHTTILHEVGHLFVNAGRTLNQHIYPDDNSIMRLSSCTFQDPLAQVVQRTLGACDASLTLNYYNPKIPVTIKNNFGNSDGGIVKVDGNNQNSPYTVTNWRTSSFPHTAEAIDGQEIPDGEKTYKRRFTTWTRPGGAQEGTVQISIPSQTGAYEASFRKEFNITFQNSLLGSSSGGVVTVNSNQVAAPTSSFPVVQDQNIAAAAIDQTIQGIMYTFNHWTDGTNNYYGYSQTFTPTDHTNLTAVFDAQPYYVTNLHRTSYTVGSHFQITWDEHPHPNVSRYDIYRHVTQIPGYITVDGPRYLSYRYRGSTSYTDVEYTVSAPGAGMYDLRYDVRPYFSLNGTSAPVRYSSFGEAGSGISPESHDVQFVALPTTTEVSNYPNPFNPSTTIKYQIAEPSFVRITVYDVMGRRVKELQSDVKPVGYYNVTWDGTSDNVQTASSGIYFLYFTARPDGKKEMFTKTINLLLSK